LRVLLAFVMRRAVGSVYDRKSNRYRACGAGGKHVLYARNLTKFYSAIAAVRNVSFSVAPGAILGLLGPNGSGKSTTVSILTGLLEPSGGQVFFNGVDTREQPLQYRTRVGY